MFSCNGKISEKQICRMMMLYTFSGMMFILPYLSARLLGKSIVPGLLLFFVFACIYVMYIYEIAECYEGKGQKQREVGMVAQLNAAGGCGKFLLFIQWSRQVIRLLFFALLTIELLKEAQIPFLQQGEEKKINALLAILPFLLVALYGANVAKRSGTEPKQDIEKQGRIAELLFWALFIPFIVVMLFGLGEVDYRIFVPHKEMSFWKMMICGYVLLIVLLPVENYLYLRPMCVSLKRRGKQDKEEKKDRHIRVSWKEVMGTIVLVLWISLLVIGIYGINGAANEEMVTIAIMRYIRLPFNILQRFDVLMIWFLMTGCFVLLCSGFYFSARLLAVFFPNWSRVWLLAVILLLVVIGILCLPGYREMFMGFLRYAMFVDIPLSVLIPAVGLRCRR